MRRSAVIVLASLHVCSFVGADTVYFTDVGTDRIQSANTDGSNLQTLVTGLPNPKGIAIDATGGKVYWTDQATEKIQRSNLDGTGIEDVVTLGGSSSPEGLALDSGSGKLYWADLGRIRRANIDGTGVETIVSGLNAAEGVALDLLSGKVYWTDIVGRKIQRSDLDGSNVEDLITASFDPAFTPVALAVDPIDQHFYWTEASRGASIRRANLDGTDMTTLISDSDLTLDNPLGISLDLQGGKLYWADHGTDTISRANLDGSNPEIIIDSSSGLTGPAFVTIGPDAVVVPLPAAVWMALPILGMMLFIRWRRTLPVQ